MGDKNRYYTFIDSLLYPKLEKRMKNDYMDHPSSDSKKILASCDFTDGCR
jgi:hypothetical protein